MAVITVSGSLASGAREVAQATAAEMRLEYPHSVEESIPLNRRERREVTPVAV